MVIKKAIYLKCRKVKRIIWGVLGLSVTYNVNHDNHDKRCLLVYKTSPFKTKKWDQIHQNIWQIRELARIIGTYDYEVDVIDFDDPYTKLKKNYDMVIGLIPRSIDVYSTHMNKSCKRIAYLTSSNLEYTNLQELKRIEEVYRRRGIRLQPRRQGGHIGRVIESFDGAMFIGNEYNFTSYKTFQMPPTYYIRNNGYEFDYPIDFSKKKATNFVFFGSVGQVHKGLDLLLEIFSQNGFPFDLYVCGMLDGESDFCTAYYKELYQTPNIHTIGFVEVGGKKFWEITEKCAYTILPSCAEATVGSILTMMSAGMIPIISKDCGIDETDAICLPDCKIETIEQYIYDYSKRNQEWVITKGKLAIEIINQKYSKKHFTESIVNALDNILL
ncbi:glycosyltransferase [Lachnospiraceae bacterium 62-35]